MGFTMTAGTGPNAVVYTGDEWMAMKPEERLRLISIDRYTFARVAN